jgi:hypothetical protein
VACDRFGVRYNQALPGELSGIPFGEDSFQKPSVEKNVDQTQEEMTLDGRYQNTQWEQAFAQIINSRKNDLEPVLIVRGDDLERLKQLRAYFKSREEIYQVLLGSCSKMTHLGIELLFLFDKEAAERKMESRNAAHENFASYLGRKISKLPFRPVIVVDECHYMTYNSLFKVLRLINQLDGKAIFVFLLAHDHFPIWIKKSTENKMLNFFLKSIKHKYEFAD